MYLQSIVVNNYRPFYGENTFDFKFNDDINFNVISGKNGCGKSALVDALYWCLYGVEFLNEGIQPICNYSAIDESDVDDEIHVSVTCNFVENNQIFKIKRGAYFIKINEFNETKIRYSPFEAYIRDEMGKWLLIDEIDLNRYFPKYLLSFLFYDNEYDSNKYLDINLKDILYKFSIKEVLDKIDLHLENLMEYYNKEIKLLDYDPGHNKYLLLQQDKIMANLRETEAEINKVAQDIKKLKQERLGIEKELSNYFYQFDDKDVINERNLLKSNIDLLQQELGELYKNKQKLLIREFPILVALSTISDKFDYEELKSIFLKNDVFINSQFYRAYFDIPNLFNEMRENHLKKYLKEIYLIHDKREALYNRLEDIEVFLSQVDAPTFKKLNSSLDRNNWNIENLSSKLKKLKSIKKSLEHSLKINSLNLKKSHDTEERISPLMNKYQFCLNTKEFGNILSKEFNNVLLNEFSNEINHLFIDKFRMGEKFIKVIIEDSHDIFLIKHSNQKISIEDLSSSEKKLFKLSLIFSIHKSLNLKYPIILMDPFVNLDIEKRESIISFLMENISNYQILLILNENQYDDSLKSKFLMNDVKEFDLIEVNGDVEVSYDV